MKRLLRLTSPACSPQLPVGEWLSLVEHLVRDQGVGGSNPLSPTNKFWASVSETYNRSHFDVWNSDRMVGCGNVLLSTVFLSVYRCMTSRCRGFLFANFRLKSNRCFETVGLTTSGPSIPNPCGPQASFHPFTFFGHIT